MGLRNLPTDVARPLTSLIDDAEPGRVSSRSLTRLSDVCQIMPLSFAAGESVSDEEYPADTMYYLLEGCAGITFAQEGRAPVPLAAGEVLLVPAGVRHAVEPAGAIKLLQLSL